MQYYIIRRCVYIHLFFLRSATVFSERPAFTIPRLRDEDLEQGYKILVPVYSVQYYPFNDRNVCLAVKHYYVLIMVITYYCPDNAEMTKKWGRVSVVRTIIITFSIFIKRKKPGKNDDRLCLYTVSIHATAHMKPIDIG